MTAHLDDHQRKRANRIGLIAGGLVAILVFSGFEFTANRLADEAGVQFLMQGGVMYGRENIRRVQTGCELVLSEDTPRRRMASGLSFYVHSTQLRCPSDDGARPTLSSASVTLGERTMSVYVANRADVWFLSLQLGLRSAE